MNKKLEQLEMQKLLQEYNFLMLDEEYKKEMIDQGKGEFLSKVHELRVEMGIGVAPPPPPPQQEQQEQPKKQPKIDPDKVDKSTKDKVKKTYREIAKKTHPDRINSDEYLETYMRATKAADEYDLFELWVICNELHIEVEIDLSDKATLTALIQSKRKELHDIESSFIWLWLHAKNDEEKNNVVKIFVEKHGLNM
jgi:hypothetical protein